MIVAQVITDLVNKAKSVGVRVNVEHVEDGDVIAEFNDSTTFEFTGDIISTNSDMNDVLFIDEQLDIIIQDREKRKLKVAARRNRRSVEDEEIIALAAA